LSAGVLLHAVVGWLALYERMNEYASRMQCHFIANVMDDPILAGIFFYFFFSSTSVFMHIEECTLKRLQTLLIA
jgi:hypothetical protein